MLAFQIIIIAFALFALNRAIRKFREGKVGVKNLCLWLILWVGVSVVVLVPNIASRAAAALGITRGVDLVMYVAVLVLCYLIFRVLVKIESLEQEITKIVRAVALRDQTENQKSPPRADLPEAEKTE